LCFCMLVGTTTMLISASSEQSDTQGSTKEQTEDTAGTTTLPDTASFLLIDGSNGSGASTFYMTLPEGSNATSYALYWSDANGNRLPGYSAFYTGKITSGYVLISINESFTVPDKARSVLVYTYSESFGESTTGFLAATDFSSLVLPKAGKKLAEFVVVSDTHVGRDKQTQASFSAMLKDIKANSPDAAGIFIVGSAVEAAEDEYYELLAQLYAKEAGLPPLYRAIGTHEFLTKGTYLYDESAYTANLQRFFRYVKHPSGSALNTPYYTFNLGTCTMIVLGADSYQDGKAVISSAQLSWLAAVLSSTNPEKPVFVFLHEPLPNTVTGTQDQHGCGDVYNYLEVQNLLDRYTNVVMFNGHSHRSMNETKTMFRLPEGSRIFNTASAAYLWTDDGTGGYEIVGSQGYYVTIYEDAVLVRGRDFTTGEWLGQAEYRFSVKTPEPVTTAATTTAPGSSATTKAPDETEPIEEKTSLRDLIPPLAILAMMAMVVFILLFKPTHKKTDES
ncbi:MAG: metallophosphoesterase, partial [Clostridia bacterium]|nr:metallophosphoesterase [Clostridia bacterium]